MTCVRSHDFLWLIIHYNVKYEFTVHLIEQNNLDIHLIKFCQDVYVSDTVLRSGYIKMNKTMAVFSSISLFAHSDR